jgi:hypothetical protein
MNILWENFKPNNTYRIRSTKVTKRQKNIGRKILEKSQNVIKLLVYISKNSSTRNIKCD